MSRQQSKRAKLIASGLSKTDCIPIAEKRKVYYNSTMNKFNNELTAVSNLRKSKCLPIIKKHPKNDEYINLSPTKNQLVQKWLDSQCTELFIPQYSETLMDQPNNEFTVTPELNLETSGIVPIVEIKKNISNPENATDKPLCLELQPMDPLVSHGSQYFKEKRNTELNITDIFDQLSSVSEYDDSTKDANYLPPGDHNSLASSESDDHSNVVMNQHLNVVEDTSPVDKSIITNTRKRLIHKENWQKNIKKQLKNSGKEYVGANDKVKAAKIMKMPCNEKCRLKCTDKLKIDERAIIHNNYWKLADINKQREFIIRHMSTINPKYRSKLPTNRSLNYSYNFTVNNEKIKVCKTMFMNTLGISSRVIFTTTQKMCDGILEEDKRGKHGKHGRAISLEVKDNIRSHITSFPAIESHYCRSATSKKFIDGSLNISLMYKLYVEYCINQKISYGKKHIYETIFNEEFNISFHSPKKDLCMCCESYKNKSGDDKLNEENKYNEHRHEKNLSRKEKNEDSKLGEDVVVCCFDLQAVLITPRGEVSQFYYKRRLASYNFTVYDIKNNQGTCFFWHEGISKRGSNEIGSCLHLFLQNKEGKDIIFYSDNCGGQNKNKYIISLLIYCVKKFSIRSITLKYLIVGHTQNEGDSMHARIEDEAKRILKGGPIYEPSQWVSVIKCAKKTGKPYVVHEMQKDQFFDLKQLALDVGQNFKINQTDENVLWSSIKMIRIEHDNPYLLKYKTSYADTSYKIIDTRKKCRKTFKDLKLCALQNTPKISQEKKKDLLALCNSHAIPKNHWAFYQQLEVDSKNSKRIVDTDSET